MHHKQFCSFKFYKREKISEKCVVAKIRVEVPQSRLASARTTTKVTQGYFFKFASYLKLVELLFDPGPELCPLLRDDPEPFGVTFKVEL